jgi:predicted DNA-binding transcriptional regulator AlpA
MRNEKLNAGAKAMPHTTEELLTRRDVAKLFQISPISVIRLERSGKLPAVRIGLGTVRYRRSDVLNFIAASICAV